MDESRKLLESFASIYDQICSNRDNGCHFTFFDALKVTRREIYHSRFLAWLFSGIKQRDLSNEILKRFLNLVQQSSGGQEIIHDPYYSVRTEVELDGYGRIDILIESINTIIAIENKVDASEHGNQLSCYDGWLKERCKQYKILVFLTPDGRAGSIEDTVCLSYGDIVTLLEKGLDDSRIPSNVLPLITQYVTLCKRIYQRGDMMQIDPDARSFLEKQNNLKIALELEQQTAMMRWEIAKEFSRNLKDSLEEELKKADKSDIWEATVEPMLEHLQIDLHIRRKSHKDKPCYWLKVQSLFLGHKQEGFYCWTRPEPKKPPYEPLDNDPEYPVWSSIKKDGGVIHGSNPVFIGGRRLLNNGFKINDNEDLLKCWEDNKANRGECHVIDGISDEIISFFKRHVQEIEKL